jgi:hypothetical protein
MFNQALVERLLILDDEVIDATPAPWLRALEDVAREPQVRRTRGETSAGTVERTQMAVSAEGGPERP